MSDLISPQLAVQIRDGNHQAFETLFYKFYPKVKSFIKVLVKNDDLAEELAQQIFVDLWIHRQKLDPAQNLHAYIYKIVRNNTLSAIKKQMKYETTDVDLCEELVGPSGDDDLIAKETEFLMKRTVESMPPKRKRVYEMSRYEDKSNEEIAHELNISRKVVEKHLRLAINELRRVLTA